MGTDEYFSPWWSARIRDEWTRNTAKVLLGHNGQLFVHPAECRGSTAPMPESSNRADDPAIDA
jgi:hypothetical protein